MSSRYTMWLVAIALVMSHIAHAQEQAAGWQCGVAKRLNGNAAAKTTIADAGENNYDMKYVKLNLNASNTDAFIWGDATTVAQVSAASLSDYVFELGTPMIIDSVFIDGAILPVTTTGDVRTVTLPASLPAGTLFTAKVFYHGTPTSTSTFFSAGLSNLTSPSWGNKITSTLSESYKAKDWWPCKQSLTDKIDSSEVWITVPDSLMAGSNGLLQSVTTVDTAHHRYEWKEKYPIDYYLISIAVGGYVDYSYYMHFSGSTDSMLVQNYIYNNPLTLPHFKNVIDSTGMMIDYFSKLYGRYPFWQEKYGHCMAPISGGMEHQTMTTIGYFDGTIVAHELGHQWFGDNATCATWADIAMNEGFAAYTEYLFIDHFRNHTQAIDDITKRHRHVRTEPGGSVYVDDTTDENRIFDGRLTYDKGASVLHSLRFVINDDSVFFSIYKLYQALNTNGTATIADFKNVVTGYAGATVNGINIDSFFNQWIYRQGFPIYTVKWNEMGSDVYLQLDQVTSMPSSVSLFTVPLELKLRSATGDTVIKVINDQPSQSFHFTWSKPTMYNVVVDPNAWLIDSVAGVTHDLSLSAGNLSVPGLSVQPNPSADQWVVNGLQQGSSIDLMDVAGRVVWHTDANTGSQVVVPCGDRPAGLYLLRIREQGRVVTTCKLVKE